MYYRKQNKDRKNDSECPLRGLTGRKLIDRAGYTSIFPPSFVPRVS